MLTHAMLRDTFQEAVAYREYVATGRSDQIESWSKFHAQVQLADPQRKLLGSFTRRMPVLVISGLWCGDCVQQCPILERIAAAGRMIDLRFVDRDAHADLADQVRICGGLRVPTAIFMNEDFEFVSLLGDRTLSRYRAVANRHLGPSCPLPGAPACPDEIAATAQDWVNEFERVQLMLRLSAKLRERYRD
ncbi:MAG: thioredoxin family protein [Phycisphaerales bacterium]|nr:thioredoxin family protein [Phycisphaerales bacterium]